MLGTILKEITSQKRITVFLLALFAVLLCNAVLLPAKDNPMGIKDKQDITLSAPTLVGGTVLPAGDYKVTHEMQGQTHNMIFKQSHGTAEVKTKCTLVPLDVLQLSGRLAGDVKELRNDSPTRDLQMAADRTRPHTLCGPVVSSLFSFTTRC
jgi:hypothetical protein